ncbi:hypothetical protein BC828DRAFT_390785 [Blastocladiella britannica]|nr:hypothetical protein BC828DRAFT_390785 [Blastocladiella britannica]
MPKDAKDHSVKHTCCGCMHIRTGVMVLQTLEILSNTFGIVVGVMAAIGSAPFNESIGKLTGSTRDDGYILTAVHSAGLLLSMFGLVSVVNRKVGGFTVRLSLPLSL